MEIFRKETKDNNKDNKITIDLISDDSYYAAYTQENLDAIEEALTNRASGISFLKLIDTDGLPLFIRVDKIICIYIGNDDDE